MATIRASFYPHVLLPFRYVLSVLTYCILLLPLLSPPLQVVVVPIHYKDKPNEALDEKAQWIVDQLVHSGLRAHFDGRTNYKPGWKYNHW